MKRLFLTVVLFVFGALISKADIWDEIRSAALAPNNDGVNGRALPLAGSWLNGWYKYRYNYDDSKLMLEPSEIIGLIEKQHHLLVNFWHLDPVYSSDFTIRGYYDNYLNGAKDTTKEYTGNAIDYLKLKNQPIVIGGTQYEQDLYLKAPYNSQPYATSPLVYSVLNGVQNFVTPCPPADHWNSVGIDWTGSDIMADFQSLYPSPPKIIFLSNNESKKLNWASVTYSGVWSPASDDQHYRDSHPDYSIQSDNDKRHSVADGWTTCYGNMIDGMRSGLTAAWENNSIFAGYCASGPWGCFGRFNGWTSYSLHYDSEIAWEQQVWDGGSMSYYLNPNSDYKVMSLQVAAQNRVFMLADQLSDNPDFWHELSVWHGGSDYISGLQSLGQTYNSSRYKGLVQFGMFLLTPRIVRHFMLWTASRNADSEGTEYFDAVMDAVDRVHSDPALKKFWKYGVIVENASRIHPYQTDVPAEFASRARWFQLNTNLDPVTLTLTTEIPVFALARVIGLTPNREWLVYAHSPLQDRVGVTITIPGYGNIVADVSREGTFIHLKENINELIAYYQLNGNANDISGNGNNGTLINAPTFASAKINYGINLIKSSSQYINCGRSALLSAAMNELTVSAWVKANTLQTSGFDWIIGKGTILNPNATGFSLRCLNKTLAFFVGAPTNYVYLTGPSLTENTWYHIAAVFKGGQYMKLYVNGVEYAKTTGVPATLTASTDRDLHIGNGSYCSYPWNGMIDEVKIFNRALSATEIIEEAHRLLQLDFEKNTNRTVEDLSRNGNTGTLAGSPSPTLTRTRVAGNNAIQLQRSGSQYVNCGQSASLNGANELTIDLWAKADTLQASSYDWILGKGSLLSPRCGYSLRCAQKTLQFFVAANDTNYYVSGPVIKENVWYHIICVYKGGQYFKMIVNGVEYTTTVVPPVTIAASDNWDLWIGGGSYSGYFWNGIIDEVKIYNKALY
jgi:hypothetical protein